VTIASYREADAGEGLARAHLSLRTRRPPNVPEDVFGLLDLWLASEPIEPDFPPILGSHDLRGLPVAAIVGSASLSVGPAYSPLILANSHPHGLALSCNEHSVQTLGIAAQVSPVSMDDLLDLQEDPLTFHSEQFIWRRHTGLAKEKFHILYSGGVGPRNWNLDELLVFLNELLPDWGPKNFPRHYPNADG
jgi:hypothetical protein